jgi:hypothetical protein
MNTPRFRSTLTLLALRRSPRGQAMVEYSVVAHALFFTVAVGAYPFLSQMLNALTKYYQSIYWVLTSPIP